MKFIFSEALIISLLSLQSCANDKGQGPVEALKEMSQSVAEEMDSKKFQFNLPEGWSRLDTTLMDSEVTLLMKADENFRPVLSVSTEFMGIKTHQRYVEDCKAYLLGNTPGIQVKEQGTFAVSGRRCIWFAYDKTQNGMTRAMAFYSIAYKATSCNITAGVNPGGREVYRQTMDEIVQSCSIKK